MDPVSHLQAARARLPNFSSIDPAGIAASIGELLKTNEIELDALRTMKTDFETAARNVETTIHDNLREHEKDLNDTWHSAVGSLTEAAGDAGSTGSDMPSWRGSTAALAPKRRNWRVKQAAAPAWYKRATTRRTHVQSGAARVARHQPASLRRPTHFF